MKNTLLLMIALVGCGESKEAVVEQANACKTNLKTLDTVITTWMVDKKRRPGDEVTIEDLAEFFDGEPPECPSGGEYTLTSAKGEKCTCSIHTKAAEDKEE